jgi:hypothetical protein
MMILKYGSSACCLSKFFCSCSGAVDVPKLTELFPPRYGRVIDDNRVNIGFASS